LGFCPVGSGAGTFSYRKPCCEVIYTETHLRGRSPPHQYQYGRCARGRSDHEAISGRGLYAAWCVLRMRAWSMSCACNGSKMSQPPRATIHCPTGATPACWTLRPPTSSHHPMARMPSLTCRICPLQVYSRPPSTPVGVSSISTTAQCKVHGDDTRLKTAVWQQVSLSCRTLCPILLRQITHNYHRVDSCAPFQAQSVCVALLTHTMCACQNSP
jgi:hypothetical protein